MKIPTYQDPIDAALVYRNQNTPDALRKAEELLRDGMREHPYALPIGNELVVVLELQGLDEDALALLRELEMRHRDAGPETWCRFGKLFKKRAEKFTHGGNPAAAIPCLLEAEQYYARAYEKARSFYPRINQLTTRFLRASLLMRIGRESEAEQLLQEVRKMAVGMLKDDTVWELRFAEDQVWSPATHAEVNLLLGNWPESAQSYQNAMRMAKGRQFYIDCMKNQAKMLLAACPHLKLAPVGPLTEPDVFFILPQTDSTS